MTLRVWNDVLGVYGQINLSTFVGNRQQIVSNPSVSPLVRAKSKEIVQNAFCRNPTRPGVWLAINKLRWLHYSSPYRRATFASLVLVFAYCWGREWDTNMGALCLGWTPLGPKSCLPENFLELIKSLWLGEIIGFPKGGEQTKSKKPEKLSGKYWLRLNKT